MLRDPLVSEGHTIIDLGDDVFTQGRLHPMLDNTLRIRRLRSEAADPEVALLLLDVVLGEGAHLDPASELAPVITEVVRKQGVEVVAIVVGTDQDPQGLEQQCNWLVDSGAKVFDDTVAAVEYAIFRLGKAPVREYPALAADAFSGPLAAINVGVESFYDSLISQGAQALQMDWRPPAGGDEQLMSLLTAMKSK
jgi:FdrA protein